MKAVIYVRVSSKEQEREGFSIDAQLEKCRKHAVDNGCEVVKEFIDVESAKQTGRTHFTKMIELLRKTPVDAIICHKVDRLCRNFRDYVTVDELTVKPMFVEEEFADNAAGKLTFGLKVLLAKHYIDNLSDEVKKGLRQKIAEGQWPHKAPYGYRNAGPRKTIEIEPVEAGNVLYLFKAYATGDYSLQAIRRKFKVDGLIYTRNHAVMSKGQLEHILKNPIYFGMMRINGNQYPGKHKPIISRELFQKVQETFQAANKPKMTKREFAYAGLMICANCGCAITAEIKKGRYIYYHCTGSRGQCKVVYVQEEELDKQFEEVVKGLQIGDEYYDLIIKTLRESHKDEKEFYKKAVDGLRKRHSILKKRIAKAYEDKLDGVITEEQWLELTSGWQAQIDEIDVQLKAHSRSDYSYLEQGIRIIELAKNAYSSYLRQNQGERRKMIQMLLSNLKLDGRNLHYDYKKPFNFLVEGQNRPNWLGS